MLERCVKNPLTLHRLHSGLRGRFSTASRNLWAPTATRPR